MKHLVLISVVLLSFNAWTEEWSAYIDTPVNKSRYIGRFETKEECQAMSACYIEKLMWALSWMLFLPIKSKKVLLGASLSITRKQKKRQRKQKNGQVSSSLV